MSAQPWFKCLDAAALVEWPYRAGSNTANSWTATLAADASQQNGGTVGFRILPQANMMLHVKLTDCCVMHHGCRLICWNEQP